jgi:hypothetical protein
VPAGRQGLRCRFGVDIALGGVLSGDVEEITADDLLGFAGIAPPRLRVVPIETHLAEKLHAYTMPRDRPNTRVKDLPDLALLGTIRPLDAARVREAIERTFGSRRVHPVPSRLPSPPEAWTTPYARMAELDDLPWRTLAEVESVARAFLDPLLSSERGRRWDPGTWSWNA